VKRYSFPSDNGRKAKQMLAVFRSEMDMCKRLEIQLVPYKINKQQCFCLTVFKIKVMVFWVVTL